MSGRPSRWLAWRAAWQRRSSRVTFRPNRCNSDAKFPGFSASVRRKGPVVGVLALLLLGEACGADLPNDRRWASDHFVFHTRSTESTACADILTLLEAHFATAQAYLNFRWPQGRVIDYYKFVDKNDLDGNSDCGGGARCTSGSVVESDNAFDPHELIHAYLAPTGEPMPVIVEGAAVALACEMAGRAQPTLQVDGVLGLGDSSADLYTVGGWLVSFLLDEFGPAKLLDIYAQLRPGTSAAQADAVFGTTYGMTFAEIWAAATAEDVPRNVCPWECSQPAIAIDGGPVDTHGGVCGQGNVERTFSAVADANLTFSSKSSGFRVGDCGHHASVPPAFVLGGAGAAGLFHLAAGDYFLQHSNEAGTITATSADPAALAASCAAASGSDALAAFDRVSVFVPRTPASWFVPIAWPRNRSLSVSSTRAQASALLCPSCGGDPSLCAGATPGGFHSLATVDTLLLKTDPGTPMSAFLLLVR